MSWGCHTCGRIHRAPFLWLARMLSIRQERRDHGFSVYDRRRA